MILDVTYVFGQNLGSIAGRTRSRNQERLAPPAQPHIRSISNIVLHCAGRLHLRPEISDADRIIRVRLSDLGADKRDPIIRALGALAAKRVFTDETIIRLALQHIRQQ
jgi:hypothetical protein